MTTATAPFHERESGLVVPAHLASVPEAGREDATPDVPRDPDGRRRLVLSREVRQKLTRIVAETKELDLGFFFACRAVRYRFEHVKDAATGEEKIVRVEEPIPGACGEIMMREDEGGVDPGFGCKCTRIHFLKRAL
jgi:hypothetical protein